MSVDFRHSITIDRPAGDVFEFISDFENNARWQSGMVSAAWTSEQKRVVGATYVQRAKFMGRFIDTHFRVSAFEPGQSISIESTISTFPIQVTRAVAEAGSACEVSVHVRGQPKGVMKWLGAFVRKSVTKDYSELKRLLESA